jgi:ribosomal protein S18 acetylase RimI-like enzyme
MSGSVADWELGRAIVASHCAFFRRLGRPPGGENLTHLGITRYASGVDHPIFNGAFSEGPSSGTAADAIEDVLAFFGQRGLPFTWWSLPGRDSADLGTALVARGLVRETESPGMALDLSRPLDPPPVPAGLKIAPLDGTSEMEVYGQTLNAGDFQAPEAVARHIPRILAPDRGDSRFKFFMGWLDGRPVATSLLFAEAGVAGIYGVATVPDARRRGIGAALTFAAVEAGRQAGFRHAVLVATAMGAPVYRRLGFEEVCRIGSFVREGTASEP